MNTGLKIGLIVGGVAAVGVAAYFIVKAVKNKKDGGTDDVDETETEIDDEIDYGNTATVSKEWFAGYVAERPGTENDLTVHFANPRPEFLDVKKNDSIRLVDMGVYSGDYTVNGVWKDSNGKAGAIYLNTGLVTASNSTNRTWEGKGKIQLMSL